ncbi:MULTISPECIES: hybrid sensor histidine kinase/response regulator [Nostocales]|uniref:histidine kinase n=3 Tax=Nostocales TaxID=1161 RepID=A0A8S9SZV6_9CYAN|nr:hybrid sensor histidine kinase/response regulator [Tolypothrix bouteillei]KAF3884819.1 hybrid sensor histidine kinase/response regulator [Tolypothrix bouteillei VB521301]
MTFDEQSYQYFLQEAQELLQEIEQELLSLREGFDINKVYNLMRATHTLKGAAASINSGTIATIAHSLEDIFRAICKPNLCIGPEVEALLFESYECLYLSLNAEFTGSLLNEAEILDRISDIFAQLQEQMGDSFSLEADLPNSEELGFDLTKSIFELGVTQRLDELAAAIASADPEQIFSLLRTQAEVFFGLGESLNLPGFQAIAQSVLSALNNYPNQSITIARIALVNFQEARTSILNGDRTQGGEPSRALQQLTTPRTRVTDAILNSYDTPQPTFPTLEQATSVSHSTPSFSNTVRVNVEHLEQLNYFIGELLTNQNRQSLQNEQLWSAIRVLSSRLVKHQQQLYELTGDWELGIGDKGDKEDKKEVQITNLPSDLHSPIAQTRSRLSSQRSISNPYLLIQSILEDTVQLIEASEAVEMFARESQETLEKQRRLLIGSHDSLMEARMLPLGNLFERFPRILQQLEIVHKKQIALEFHGSDTLVDKAVVERLYDPLLHLVRNAFDHGIEAPSTRQEWGKPDKGVIEIRAYHQGRYLIVEVQDDGQGLDFERIRNKAVEEGLISPQYAINLSHEEIINLLFEPGFSTASTVNNLSGRGMGLDVVRTHLRAIQGTVSVYSEPHRGTMFRLQIPLKLTIDKLLVCQADEKIYALFANAIEEIIIPKVEQVRCWDGGKALRWRKGDTETLIPIYQLATALNYSSPISQFPISQPKHSFADTENKMMPVILIRCQERLLGLEVERLFGELELAIRPLGSAIAPPPYVYGGSILADGRLTLVLDGTALINHLSEQQTQENANNFVSSVPLMPNLKHQQLPIQTRAALADASNFEKKPCKTILLVDDSITVRQTLSLTLQKAGYQVVQAKDGYEAIEQIRYHSDIQLVFCDIEMPRMNGFEFLKTRQQDPNLSDIPVVMLTSRSSDKHRLLAFKLGANAYITKPYLEHMLLTTVTDVLEKKN